MKTDEAKDLLLNEKITLTTKNKTIVLLRMFDFSTQMRLEKGFGKHTGEIVVLSNPVQFLIIAGRNYKVQVSGYKFKS